MKAELLDIERELNALADEAEWADEDEMPDMASRVRAIARRIGVQAELSTARERAA